VAELVLVGRRSSVVRLWDVECATSVGPTPSKAICRSTRVTSPSAPKNTLSSRTSPCVSVVGWFGVSITDAGPASSREEGVSQKSRPEADSEPDGSRVKSATVAVEAPAGSVRPRKWLDRSPERWFPVRDAPAGARNRDHGRFEAMTARHAPSSPGRARTSR
jgi:hypothetical protein